MGTLTLVLVVSAGEGFEDEEAAVEVVLVVVVVVFVWFLLPLEEGEDGGDRTLCCLLFRGIVDIVSTVRVKSFPLSLENWSRSPSYPLPLTSSSSSVRSGWEC